jgi:hypothetical protein
MNITKPPLAHRPLLDALSLILPSPEQTWLLRALLLSGEPARQAWGLCQGRTRDLRRTIKKDRGGIKTLAPLLHRALQRNMVDADEALLTSLRAASLREELRNRSYRRIVQSVLSALSTGGIPHIVVEEAALADTVYDDPALRHCHRIDLLVSDGEMLRAAGLLPSAGFAPPAGDRDPAPDHLAFRHESGLALELHRRLSRNRYYTVPSGELWARSQTAAIAGLPTRVLSPADNLLHVCLLASTSGSREPLVWVADAWHLITRYPDLEWDVLLDCATRNRLALPVSITLGYLAEALDAPIPATVVDHLRAAAAQTDRLQAEAAIAAAFAGTRGTLRGLARMSGGWRPRALCVKWMLFPSPGYVRATFRVSHPWLLPLYYVYRPLRYVGRRLLRRFTGHVIRRAAASGTITAQVGSGE